MKLVCILCMLSLSHLFRISRSTCGRTCVPQLVQFVSSSVSSQVIPVRQNGARIASSTFRALLQTANTGSRLWRHPEQGAIAIGTALGGGAINIALLIEDQAPYRVNPVPR